MANNEIEAATPSLPETPPFYQRSEELKQLMCRPLHVKTHSLSNR
jgi:hypothetical protein